MTANNQAWNAMAHQQRVGSDYYSNLTRNVFAPQVAAHITSVPRRDAMDNLVHDIGGYDGMLVQELLSNHLGPSWKGVISDVTTPPSMVARGAKFYETPAWQIGEVLGKSTVGATITCNTLHLLADEELDRTVRAVIDTSRPGAPIITITPHPITHRVTWSDYAGMNVPEHTKRRGVFLDDYRPDRAASHAFLEGVTSYPRTVEAYLGRLLAQGLRLVDVQPLHVDRAAVADDKSERYYETLSHLPTYLLTAWRVEK